MAFIPVPNAIKITMSFLSDAGVIAQNVFHCHSIVPGVQSEQQSIVDIFQAWWEAHYKALTTVNWQLQYIEARDVSIEAGTTLVETIGSVATGAGSASADNVSAVVTWRTGFAGKSQRGRTYMLPPSTSNVLENTVSTTYVTALLAAAGALITSLATANNELMVISKYTNGLPRATAQALFITTPGCTGKVASQRGRLQ